MIFLDKEIKINVQIEHYYSLIHVPIIIIF